jgi:predicted dithiol-disulfide oxidoreductase (DUF899 family)
VKEKTMQPHRIVSRDEWIAARKAHLRNEKALTRMRDMIAKERQALPWVKVDKNYLFDTTAGRTTLGDLFGDNSQLIVQHFMWRHDLDQGCVGCSLHTDHAQGALVHLANHDVSFVLVSRAPLEKLQAYRKRMGWNVEWVSSLNSDFNFDYHVSFTKEQLANNDVYYNYEKIPGDRAFDELPGLSVFYKDDAGTIFHTYSSYARGNEAAISTFYYLDLTPKGRNETEVMDWVRRNDEYGKSPQSCCQAAAPERKSA